MIFQQNEIREKGAARVAAYVLKHKNINAVGGWYDSRSGLYYFDAVMIFDDKQAAIEAALTEKQIALYDLKEEREVRIQFQKKIRGGFIRLLYRQKIKTSKITRGASLSK